MMQLPTVIEACSITLAVIDAPNALTLSRLWCLWEMIATVQTFERGDTPLDLLEVNVPLSFTGKDTANPFGTIELKPHHVFHARVGHNEVDKFVPADPVAMKDVVTKVNVRTAKCSAPEDQKAIMALCEAVDTKRYGKGLNAINRMGRMALANILSLNDADQRNRFGAAGARRGSKNPKPEDAEEGKEAEPQGHSSLWANQDGTYGAK